MNTPAHGTANGSNRAGAADLPPIIKPQANAVPPVIPGAGVPKAGRSVWCNGAMLSAEQLRLLDQAFRAGVADGVYWYDRAWGAWGRQGEGRMGLLAPGLNLGGPLRADASAGSTGVFVNGRQLGYWELLRLTGIPFVPQRRYWVDAQGNFGVEGEPMRGNLHVMRARAEALGQMAVAAQVAASFAANSGNSGQREGALSSWDRTGVAVFKTD